MSLHRPNGVTRWTSASLFALACPLCAACADIWGFDDLHPGDASFAESGSADDGAGVQAGDGGNGEENASDAGVGDATTEADQDATASEGGNDTGFDAADAGSGDELGICNPSATQCSGNGVQTCTSDGRWGSTATCSGTTPYCANGTCVSGCPGSLCDSSCVDTTSNVSNCNGCGIACTGIANAAPACVASKCTFTCNTGFTLCNGECVNEQTDNGNCGGCGSAHACASGLSCQSGMCTLSQASPACSACLLANCNAQSTAVNADPLAIAVANCGLENNCVNTCCFCSGGPCTSCTGYGEGPCRAVYEMAAGVESPSVCTTDAPTLTTDCENASNSCGKANILGTCESAMCQSQCMAAACN